ncbi:conserved Plasmodium protein, unknown function [Plasmodium gallinaceum]|uniref:BSD domain-containing protein n=1 Tax=Plasmodium gallinaceum TaxID=5849 RepID=A0A1J1GP09_PLAGA|nr:conserved Plasmodium protein, unknown function [Plasmodium gallinaceum]CRG94223.1 conserved Plasmodium protein, unknown function [Plasmodium gallinaceum]
MEEEKILDSFEVLYNNEKGDLYLTNKFLIYISENTKKVKDENNSLFLIDDIDLKICVFSWKKTEKSKKKNKIRFTFAKTNNKNNFCFHDYNNTETFIFEFFNEKDYNNISEIINYLNKNNLKSHLYINFNLNLIKNNYKVYEELEISNTIHKKLNNEEVNLNNENNRSCIKENEGSNKFIEKEENKKIKNEEIKDIIGDSESHDSDENNENLNINESYLLNKIFDVDTHLKSLYDLCIQNKILNDKEFYNLHKNYIYEHKNIYSNDDINILKEPIFISEEQKNSKNVEINKEVSKLILSENQELKKLYDYYIENNILSENKFWFFLFNNRYSHLFFCDKNEKDVITNKNFLNIKDENTFEHLSYNLENLNQDIKGSLEKCILKEYLSTKSHNKKNILFKNNYYFKEENLEGFGIFTNEKLIRNNNNSYNLLINKFNNYCINIMKDKKFTFKKFYDDLKEKIDDTDLTLVERKQELYFNLEKKKNICDDENINDQLLENKDYLNNNFESFMDDLKSNKQQNKKNYSELFNIGRQLFVLNTKKCQNNQSLLIGTIDYEKHIIDIVKEYHLKINYLLNLFYTSYIPEQNKRNKILENLSKIKDEIQAKQEEYNSILIMGKPLLIHLFEQISICKKFNEKLHKYIQEKKKKT